MVITTTDRLTLREFVEDDAPFILELLNEPGWIRFIGNRGITNEVEARAYIVKGPVAMYANKGFGLWMVERRNDSAPLGMCGLIKRDTLEDVDIGFAFLARFCGMGYAYEAAAATMHIGKERFKLSRIVGITSPDNVSSIKLLEKIGLAREKAIKLNDGHDETVLMGWNAENVSEKL